MGRMGQLARRSGWTSEPRRSAERREPSRSPSRISLLSTLAGRRAIECVRDVCASWRGLSSAVPPVGCRPKSAPPEDGVCLNEEAPVEENAARANDLAALVDGGRAAVVVAGERAEVDHAGVLRPGERVCFPGSRAALANGQPAAVD